MGGLAGVSGWVSASIFGLRRAVVWGRMARVTRISLTKWLCLVLLAAVAFAGWSWFRPYEWRADPGARLRMVSAVETRDHGNCWLDLHLRPGAGGHDWGRPVRLVLRDGRELEPADTRMTGDAGRGLTGLWLKFWLEADDLQGPLRLRLNEGTLAVKSRDGAPPLGLSGRKVFTTSRW
jgi:hypothetical protein